MRSAAAFKVIVGRDLRSSWGEWQGLIHLIRNLVHRIGFWVIAMPVGSREGRISGYLDEEVRVIVFAGAERGLLGVHSPSPSHDGIKFGALDIEPMLRTVVKLPDDFEFLPGRNVDQRVFQRRRCCLRPLRRSDARVEGNIQRQIQSCLCFILFRGQQVQDLFDCRRRKS
jgi:hypothetical protein